MTHTDDAQSARPVDLFAALTKTELRELSTRMLSGAVKAGKLANYCRGDYNLRQAAQAVQDDCFDINQDCFALEFGGLRA